MSTQTRTVRLGWLVLLLVAAGLLLRSLRLAWQPLWWDEGYSVYFATEPLSRMAWLTAHDIHPPLYYALLHGWFGLVQQQGPVAARILSVLFGAAALPLLYWLARRLYPTRRRIAWFALLLLVLNPMHLFYSQEVRMYGLGMVLGLASMLAYASLVDRLQRPGALRIGGIWLPLILYLAVTTAGLYTLYYFGLLLLAQCIWAAWALRRRWVRLALFGAIVLTVVILYLPWLLYAIPLLIEYVGGKVQSDQDVPLGPMAYVERHLAAFTTGHVGLGAPWEAIVIGLASLSIAAILVGAGYRRTTPNINGPAATSSNTQWTTALWVWLLVPIAAGWLINLRFPFFPPGGERLLLIVLPYLILLLAVGIDYAWGAMQLGKVALGAMLLAAVAGIYAFYSVPRYTADDYRPLLHQIVQQGTNEDRMLAIFPWQVGYWRAYTPQKDPLVSGPNPLLLADAAVEWSPDVQATLDQALSQGTVWFPEPLTFGSSLPPAIETYLAAHAVNLENRWYDATRLTAWRTLEHPPAGEANADFGVATLTGAGIAPAQASSANSPVAVSLAWGQLPPADTNISLRLQDGDGLVWSNRDFVANTLATQVALSDTVGMIAPVGLPPGIYTVTLGLQDKAGRTLTVKGSDVVAAPLGVLTIALPDDPISALRLPIQTPLSQPLKQDDLVLLGHSGADRPTPSGAELTLNLFLQNAGEELDVMNIYVSLLDAQGNGIAGYEGWSLPAYPTEAWPPGALVQAPVRFYVPGTASTGEYRLVAGIVNTTTGTKSPAVEIAKVQLEQRPANFTAPTPSQTLPTPAQFGTHVNLIGYDWNDGPDGQVDLRLYWQVQQPLLPPHHIFVHADAPDGTTVAQQDGAPVTPNGEAPTGGWQPGEYLVTEHHLAPPTGASYTVNVGIYNPDTLVRLPVTISGAPAGDNVVLTKP